MVKIGIIRPIYSHKGDFAILKGTLDAFRQLNINAEYSFIDPDVTFPEGLSNISLIRSWYTVLSQNLQSNGKLSKKAYLKALQSVLFWKPQDNIDLLWYMGGGAIWSINR